MLKHLNDYVFKKLYIDILFGFIETTKSSIYKNKQKQKGERREEMIDEKKTREEERRKMRCNYKIV